MTLPKRPQSSVRKFVEELEGEEYLHKEVWRVVDRQLKHAERNPQGALYDDLVAMVFALHSIEGYLNFLGEKIAPELWKNEKETFGRAGLDGKLEKICELCGLPIPAKGRRPRSTIVELTNLRNQIVHPKTVRVKDTKCFAEGKSIPTFRPLRLEALVTQEKAVRARDDVKQIVDDIHRAARSKFPGTRLGVDALGGILSTHSSTTCVVELDTDA